MNAPFILWLAATMAVFISAASASRAYIGNSQMWLLLVSLGLYVVGNLMMLKLMRESGLGLAISISAIAQLILINIIAFLFFGEKLTVLQATGVALGVVSMTLMLLPTAGKS